MKKTPLIEHVCGVAAAAFVISQASAIAGWVSGSLSELVFVADSRGDRIYHFIGEVRFSTLGWVCLLGVIMLTVVALRALVSRGVVSAPLASLAITLLLPGIVGLVGGVAASDWTAGLVSGVAFGTVLALGVLLYWGTVSAVEWLRISPASGAAGDAG